MREEQNDIGLKKVHMGEARDYARNYESEMTGETPAKPGQYGKGPRGWKRSDEQIKDRACEALWRSQEVDARGIDVSVEEGIVTLKGHVDSRGAKKISQRCVENIPGVEDVLNHLRIHKRD